MIQTNDTSQVIHDILDANDLFVASQLSMEPEFVKAEKYHTISILNKYKRDSKERTFRLQFDSNDNIYLG